MSSCGSRPVTRFRRCLIRRAARLVGDEPVEETERAERIDDRVARVVRLIWFI
jgi:hypothetical protein